MTKDFYIHDLDNNITKQLINQVSGYTNKNCTMKMIKTSKLGPALLKYSPSRLLQLQNTDDVLSSPIIDLQKFQDKIFDFFHIDKNCVLIVTCEARVYIYELNYGAFTRIHEQTNPLRASPNITAAAYNPKTGYLALNFFIENKKNPKNIIEIYRINPNGLVWFERVLQYSDIKKNCFGINTEYCYINNLSLDYFNEKEMYLVGTTYGGDFEIKIYKFDDTLRDEKLEPLFDGDRLKIHDSKCFYGFKFQIRYTV